MGKTLRFDNEYAVIVKTARSPFKKFENENKRKNGKPNKATRRGYYEAA